MFYKKDSRIYTRSGAINEILNEIGTSIQPAYIDDETLSLYGFYPEPTSSTLYNLSPSKEDRRKALKSVDWVVGANQLPEKTKESVEAWRWLVRNLPEIDANANIPPLPQIIKSTSYSVSDSLTEKEIIKIKNYSTQDSGWICFLQVWKDLSFTNLKSAVSNLLIAYTEVTLDEIISSI